MADKRTGEEDRRSDGGFNRRSGDDRRSDLRKRKTRRVEERRFSYGRRDSDNPYDFPVERRSEGFERWQGDRRNQNRLLYGPKPSGRRSPEDAVRDGIAGALVKAQRGTSTITNENLSGLGKISKKIKGKGGLLGLGLAVLSAGVAAKDAYAEAEEKRK